MHQSEEKRVLHYKEEDNYTASFKLDGGRSIRCYTKTQIKAMHPGRSYKIAAEYAPSARRGAGELDIRDGQPLPLYRWGSFSRLVYGEKGFVRCVESAKAYVVLLKNVLALRILLLVLALAVAAGGVFGGMKLVSYLDAAGPGVTDTGVDLDPGAQPWDGGEIPGDDVNATGIKIPGSDSSTNNADRTDATVSLVNPENNPCYFEVSLILTDTGEVLYQSKKIKPGYAIRQITLNHSLPRGVYDAKVHYDTFSLTDQKPMNGAEVKIKLIAQ